MATRFPIEPDGDYWLVLADGKCIECASKQVAEILRQIPILDDKKSAIPPDGDDLKLLEQVVKLGMDHRFRGDKLTLKMTWPRFRGLMNWLAMVSEDEVATGARVDER